MELIPGLPNEVGLECLIRVPFDQFCPIKSVCKSWKAEIELPDFRQQRIAAGTTQHVIVMAQSRGDSNQTPNSTKLLAIPVYKLVSYEVKTGYWSDLPLAPEFANGLPKFCGLVGVGFDLVVVGGYDPVTWKVLNTILIYNFVSSTWRRGKDMPGGARSFFGCTSGFNQMVFVAGGHDDEKNALRSGVAYDVAKDEWIPLPNMVKERDECRGVFQSGKFHVIGGYHSETQGHFERSVESFDVATWQWGPVQEDFLEMAMCPMICVDKGDDEEMYMCLEGDVVALKNANWQVVVGLPAEVFNVVYLTAWQGNLLVIGSPGFGEPQNAYVMELKNYTWTKFEGSLEYSGHVQSSCSLEI